MGIVFEILFEIIVEGALDASLSRKVPLWVRIIAALLLIFVYGGLVGLIIYSAISSKNWILFGAGILLLLFLSFGFYKIIKKRKKERES